VRAIHVLSWSSSFAARSPSAKKMTTGAPTPSEAISVKTAHATT